MRKMRLVSCFQIEDMASSLAFFTIFSLLLAGNAIGGRKEPGEYWRDVMKDEPMPKAIQGLLPEDQSSSLSSKKPNCQTTTEARNGDDVKPFVGDYEPRPNISAYNENKKNHNEHGVFLRFVCYSLTCLGWQHNSCKKGPWGVLERCHEGSAHAQGHRRRSLRQEPQLPYSYGGK
ncbi:unnamed protein product, partial [Vitis vinifera]